MISQFVFEIFVEVNKIIQAILEEAVGKDVVGGTAAGMLPVAQLLPCFFLFLCTSGVDEQLNFSCEDEGWHG